MSDTIQGANATNQNIEFKGGKRAIQFNNDDDWNTPKSVWESIAHLLPKDKIIFECFYGDGMSGKYLSELGFKVEHHKIDFFEDPPFDYDLLVSNPPYSMKPKVFKRLAEIDKPFMMLVPVSTMTKKFLKTYFQDKIQIIIPKSRIHFLKAGVQTKGSWFDTIFIAYRMNLVKDITYL
tara:strand:- start:264 stop:797 length:534 start_codon:yes stop_codon:yes gene_type:complete